MDESKVINLAGIAAIEARSSGLAQTAHADSEIPFRLLVESVADYAIYMLDPKGNITSWNTGAERIKGYRADEIIGRNFSCFFPDEDVHASKPEHELEAAATAGRFEDEAWRVRKDGSRFWASVVLTRLVDRDGKLLGFAKVTRDLTEHRRAEEERLIRARAQADAERRFRLLVESVADYAIYLLDPNGNVSSWNVGAERIKGYRADEILGRNFSCFFPEEDVRGGKPKRELEQAAREGRFEEEAWRVRKDGSRFWANVVLTRLLADDGTLLGFAKVTRDLTERGRLEEERIARARAETALSEQQKRDELREQLLGVVGHDLRSPLQSVVMATNLMIQRGALPDAEMKTAALIARNAERMSNMVSQLLDFTRVRLGGGVQMNPQQVELGELCAELVAEAEAAHPGRRIAFDADYFTAGMWDRDRLGQVIANLIGNAIQYSDPGSTVAVRVLDDGPDQVRLRIHNSGTIAADVLPTIFDPFRRGRNRSNKDKSGSLGLGLYIVREMVSAHGGTIEVKSSESEGTAFIVSLPRTRRLQPST